MGGCPGMMSGSRSGKEIPGLGPGHKAAGSGKNLREDFRVRPEHRLVGLSCPSSTDDIQERAVVKTL